MSELVWAPVRVRIGDLRPWERNPRRIRPAHAKRLLKSWEEFGQAQTIAIGPDGEVYDGHQRLSALLAAYGPDYEVLALQASRPHRGRTGAAYAAPARRNRGRMGLGGLLGRGVELEPRYVAVALQRLADMGLQPEPVQESQNG